MINAIIFSKNRPAQLDLLLKTLPEYFNAKVIYLATDTSFEQGYQICQSHNAIFEKEFDMKSQVLSHISEYTTFFTDDSFFYIQPDINILKEAMKDMLKFLPQFSLRLGLNTYKNYNFESLLPKFKKSFVEKSYIYWNTKEYNYDEYYGYKMSVDGHIYKGEDLINILNKISWGNPNIIECEMNKYENLISDEIGCFKQSVLVVNPVNRVQDVCQNWCGEKYPISAADLNQMYLDGYRIKVPIINPDTVHYECNLC